LFQEHSRIADLVGLGLLVRVGAVERRHHSSEFKANPRSAAFNSSGTDSVEEGLDSHPLQRVGTGFEKMALRVLICLLFMVANYDTG
jgi:hypothetical protein